MAWFHLVNVHSTVPRVALCWALIHLPCTSEPSHKESTHPQQSPPCVCTLSASPAVIASCVLWPWAPIPGALGCCLPSHYLSSSLPVQVEPSLVPAQNKIPVQLLITDLHCQEFCS